MILLKMTMKIMKRQQQTSWHLSTPWWIIWLSTVPFYCAGLRVSENKENYFIKSIIYLQVDLQIFLFEIHCWTSYSAFCRQKDEFDEKFITGVLAPCGLPVVLCQVVSGVVWTPCRWSAVALICQDSPATSATRIDDTAERSALGDELSQDGMKCNNPACISMTSPVTTVYRWPVVVGGRLFPSTSSRHPVAADLWRAGAHSANEGSENWLLLNLLTVICFQTLNLSLAVVCV